MKKSNFRHVIPSARPIDAREIAQGVKVSDVIKHPASVFGKVVVRTDGWFVITTGLKK